MAKYFINGVITILIAGVTLYIVYELTASDTYSRVQAVSDQQSKASSEACFIPGDDCEAAIVRTINTAVRRIHVQAYLFTNEAIARALENAVLGHLEVIVILDKRERGERSSVAPELVKAGVRVLLDNHPAIAHNKTIIVDPDGSHPIVETGSFNFTYGAEHRNAENVLIVQNDHRLAAAYERYFQQRLAASEPWDRGEQSLQRR